MKARHEEHSAGLIEAVARDLARLDGHDPDESWEEFDRNAAATVTHFGEYAGWQDDVFPERVRWQAYEPAAQQVVATLVAQLARHQVLDAPAAQRLREALDREASEALSQPAGRSRASAA